MTRKEKELVKLVVELREMFRKEKKYEISDMIREELRKVGIEVQDTEKGPKIEIK